MTDARVARVERGIERAWATYNGPAASYVLADLRVWQEIAERHREGSCGVAHDGLWVSTCIASPPCPDRAAADAALDRLNALWGTE